MTEDTGIVGGMDEVDPGGATAYWDQQHAEAMKLLRNTNGFLLVASDGVGIRSIFGVHSAPPQMAPAIIGAAAHHLVALREELESDEDTETD